MTSHFKKTIIAILEDNSRRDFYIRSFCRLGGRPSVLLINQDGVFVLSETFGEVIKTRVFEDFCTEQELKL